MNEIVAALIGVGGALLLAYIQRRWEKRSLRDAWQKQAEELADQLEAAHKEQVDDLRRQLRRQDRIIASLTNSGKRKGDPDDDG